MNERRFLKTGESIMWRVFGYDKEYAIFFGDELYDIHKQYWLIGTIEEISEREITVEVVTRPPYGMRTFSKEWLFDRCSLSLLKDELRQEVRSLKIKDREARKAHHAALHARNLEDATAYEVYAITLTGSVELVTVDSQEPLQGIVYIGVSKDAHARFQQHLRKDQWLKDAIARGLQASYEVIERVAGILIARERERYWIKHHREEGRLLYNRQSLQKPPTPRHRKQRVKWTQNYLREGRRAYSEYVETMVLWRMRLKEEGFTFDEER